MSTDEAFKEMMQLRGVHKQLNITSTHARALRNNLKLKPESISLDKKIKLLQQYGYQLENELIWHPKPSTP